MRQPDGKTSTVKSEALEAINHSYKAGSLTFAEALEAARREMKRQKRLLVPTRSTTLRPANLRLLEKYWAEVYEHRNIKSPKAAYNRLKRALEALGDVPFTADRNTIQKQVNRSCKGNTSRQRTVVSALNQILKWAGRSDVHLERDFKDYPEPVHLNLSDFQKVVRHIDEPYATLFWVLFATGCRPGEAFALSSADAVVWVKRQMKEDGNYGPTKTRKPRRVPVISEGVPYLEKWLEVPEATKIEIRNHRLAEILTAACVEAFPKDSKKHLTARDLRHCYAIHLISKGVNLTMVAKSLGNSIQVCQEYYAGFTLDDESLTVVSGLI